MSRPLEDPDPYRLGTLVLSGSISAGPLTSGFHRTTGKVRLFSHPTTQALLQTNISYADFLRTMSDALRSIESGTDTKTCAPREDRRPAV